MKLKLKRIPGQAQQRVGRRKWYIQGHLSQGIELMIRAEVMEKIFVSQPIESLQEVLLSEENRGLQVQVNLFAQNS